jgi:hypothetical protein
VKCNSIRKCQRKSRKYFLRVEIPKETIITTIRQETKHQSEDNTKKVGQYWRSDWTSILYAWVNTLQKKEYQKKHGKCNNIIYITALHNHSCMFFAAMWPVISVNATFSQFMTVHLVLSWHLVFEWWCWKKKKDYWNRGNPYLIHKVLLYVVKGLLGMSCIGERLYFLCFLFNINPDKHRKGTMNYDPTKLLPQLISWVGKVANHAASIHRRITMAWNSH